MNKRTTLMVAVLGVSCSVTPLFAKDQAANTKGISALQEHVLSSAFDHAPAPEYPALARGFIEHADSAQKSATAEAIVSLIAQKQPGSLASVIATIASVNAQAGSAATKAAFQATRPGPSPFALMNEGDNHGHSGSHGQEGMSGNHKPGFSDGHQAEFDHPLPQGKGPPPPPTTNSHRPEETPGNIHGDRPTVPPGLEREPMPGREPQGPKEYGSP